MCVLQRVVTSDRAGLYRGVVGGGLGWVCQSQCKEHRPAMRAGNNLGMISVRQNQMLAPPL